MNLKKTRGVGSAVVRTIAMICLILGLGGVCLVQNGKLNMGTNSGAKLLELLEKSSGDMGSITLALMCQVIYACAAPLFAFLLVEGERHTGDIKNYLVRVLGVAAVSELPFNLATSGKILDTGSLNPGFGLAMALIALWFFRRYGEKNARDTVLRIVITVAAMLWTMMLSIQEGPCLVLITAVLWATYEKPLWRSIFGCIAALGCCIFSPFYVLSFVSVLVLHLYNGEKSPENKYVKLAIYPVAMLAIGLVLKYMF